MTAHYFAGANTANGFCDFFSYILPEDERKRMYYIKGGPGMGKSTFMKRIGAAFENAGEDVEYFHCSSDPDSLDGVCAPRRGVAIIDATAPHVCDPVIVGARDTLLPFGDFLDEKRLTPYVKRISDLNHKIKRCYKNAYGYFAAAAALDVKEGDQSAQIAFIKGYLPKNGTGKARHLFLSAYTLNGLSEFECPHKRLVSLSAPLNGVFNALSLCGTDAWAFHNPLQSENIDSVYLPRDEILITSPHEAPNSHFSALLREAQQQLQNAKSLHDELEEYYIAACEFERVDALREKLQKDLGI